MAEYNRIPAYRSNPMISRVGTGSVRSYDPRMMDFYTDPEDDFGFKSFPEYALRKLFYDGVDVNGGLSCASDTDDRELHHSESMALMPSASPATVRKKRKAPDPPSNLVAARQKYPSSDDIIDSKKRDLSWDRTGRNQRMRPTSMSPNHRRTDLLDELLGKLNSKSPSPSTSPRVHRTKALLSKLRSPRTKHKGSLRKRTSPKEDEEAGFKPLSLSNHSSLDEPDGFSDETIFFAVLPPDLVRDAEFEVQRIPEYDRYLNELLQETDKDHPDYDHLSRAAAKVRLMVKEREDELGNMDNQKRMERVQDKFPYDDLQLRDLDLQRRALSTRRKSAPGAVLFKTLGKSRSSSNLILGQSMGKKDTEFFRPSRLNNNFNRQYLMEGIVEFSRGMQTQDRYLFLFSDLLLVAKQKSNTTFKLKHRIRMCELWIADCIDDVTELTRLPDVSFVIGWPTTNYVATFKSLELKETWLNKFKEQIEDERSKLLPKILPLEVHHRDSDMNCQVEVEPVTNVLSVISLCLQQLSISESEAKDYRLWVRLGPDESPYPLCGHELPYLIKLNHIRDFGKITDDTLKELEIQRIMEEMQNNNRKYEFFLKHKKSQKRHSLDESSSKQMKSKKKSPLINIFRRHREDKKPQGKLFGHKLTDITSPENLIAKPIKELLTILFREGPYTVGIIRKSCNMKMSKDLRQKLDDGEDCLLTGDAWPALVIGAIVKEYLRSIPQSLLMEELYDDWMSANKTDDPAEKNNKIKDTLSKLPPCHYELLRHLMCVLHHIHKKSDQNKMTAYNLSVCIAPSLLWPKGNNDPLASPPGLIQYLIENCAQVFGPETVDLFGEAPDQKMRQDSSTDSDSMHSVLSSQGNFRRDDSSLDSLDREMLYSGEVDSTSHPKSHFSPSNLSGDSGLISDAQFCDEDANGNDIERRYLRSSSYIHPDVSREDMDQTSQSLEGQFYYSYDPQNPVPPPRRTRRRGVEQSPNMEYDRKQSRYLSEANFQLPNRYTRRNNQNTAEKFKRRSTESLKSVEESSEADSEVNMQDYTRRLDMGTLIKSASGAHLYFEEPVLSEFDDIRNMKNRRRFYKQSSDGALPMSPQSKYSLSGSRDSVISDSSGSYLNQQNSPDPETPEHEDNSMAEWLNQQSRHTAYTALRQRRVSQDDMEIDLKHDRRPMNKMNYLISPKTSPKSSPKLKRRSPIPLSVRRSFPMNTEVAPKGSGSNTSKEAEDIIKSPKLTVTYCSEESLDKLSFETPPKDKSVVPHLDIYNNNSQIAMKQLNIYSSGLQGTSPPPRVVLQGLNSQTGRRENTPLKGNHEILLQARRNSFDTAQFIEHKQKYLMEENSVSSEEQGDESDSEREFETRVMTMVKVPVSYDVPQKFIPDLNGSCSDSSSQSEEILIPRPGNPPDYAQAVQRSQLIKQGLSPEEPTDLDVEKVKQASLRAKQLYEQSMKQYQEQVEKYSAPSHKFEKTLDVHEESKVEEENESAGESTDEEKIEATSDPRKLYEESLKRYLEEQSGKSPLVKMSSEERGNVSLSKGDRLGKPSKLSPHGVNLHRSCSDVGDRKSPQRTSPAVGDRNSRSLVGQISGETTPSKRPPLPPPYNDPPPYRSENSDSGPSSGARRHLFPRAGESITRSSAVQSPVTVESTSRTESSSDSAQKVTLPKGRDSVILVSNRTRDLNISSHSPSRGASAGNVVTSEDHTVQSAQSEIGRYQSPAVRSRNSAFVMSAPKNSPLRSIDHSKSQNVFRNRASSLEPTQPQASTGHPRTSSQGPVPQRNPTSSVQRHSEVAKSQSSLVPQQTPRSSLDAAVKRHSIGVQKELPWSVKRLSNIFDASRPSDSTSSVSQSQASVSLSNVSSSSTRVPPPYTPPPPFQHRNDNSRSSTSSNSSIGSAYASRGGAKHSAQTYNKFGPQARDSFSSTDDSDCSCRYSLNCRRDNSSLEELADFTDITYV